MASESKVPSLDWTHPILDQYRIANELQADHPAMGLWRRTVEYHDCLCEPDAWFNPTLGTLEFKDPESPDMFPLRPGDVYRYAQTFDSELLTHDTLYIGKGVMCNLVRTKSNASGECFVQLDDMGSDSYCRRTQWQSSTPPTLSAEERFMRIHRALSSCGKFKYDILRFNCQSVVSLWINPRAEAPDSLGVRRVAACVGAALTVAIGAFVVTATSASPAPPCGHNPNTQAPSRPSAESRDNKAFSDKGY